MYCNAIIVSMVFACAIFMLVFTKSHINSRSTLIVSQIMKKIMKSQILISA